MKADGDVPAKKLDGIERVIPRRERFRLPGLVVCIRDFTKFFQEEEIFGVPVLRASEKHGYFAIIRSLSLNSFVQIVEAREDGMMVLIHQHAYLCA